MNSKSGGKSPLVMGESPLCDEDGDDDMDCGGLLMIGIGVRRGLSSAVTRLHFLLRDR